MNNIERIITLVGEDRLIQIAMNIIADELDSLSRMDEIALFPDNRSDDGYVYLKVDWNDDYTIVHGILYVKRKAQEEAAGRLDLNGEAMYEWDKISPPIWRFKARLTDAIRDILEFVV